MKGLGSPNPSQKKKPRESNWWLWSRLKYGTQTSTMNFKVSWAKKHKTFKVSVLFFEGLDKSSLRPRQNTHKSSVTLIWTWFFFGYQATISIQYVYSLKKSKSFWSFMSASSNQPWTRDMMIDSILDVWIWWYNDTHLGQLATLFLTCNLQISEMFRACLRNFSFKPCRWDPF